MVLCANLGSYCGCYFKTSVLLLNNEHFTISPILYQQNFYSKNRTDHHYQHTINMLVMRRYDLNNSSYELYVLYILHHRITAT